jgi:hypothetical protein
MLKHSFFSIVLLLLFQTGRGEFNLLHRNEIAIFGDVNPLRLNDYQSFKLSSVKGGGLGFKHFFTDHKGIRGGLFVLTEDLFLDKETLLSHGDSVFKAFWEKNTQNMSGFVGLELQRAFFKTLVFYGFADLGVGLTRGTKGEGTVFYIYGTDKPISDYLDGHVTFKDVKAITAQMKPGVGAKLNLRGLVIGAEASLSFRVNFPQAAGQITIDSKTFLNRVYVGIRF